jgi:hypothetical protein
VGMKLMSYVYFLQKAHHSILALRILDNVLAILSRKIQNVALNKLKKILSETRLFHFTWEHMWEAIQIFAILCIFTNECKSID